MRGFSHKKEGRKEMKEMKEKKMGSLPSFWGMHASRYVPLPLRSKNAVPANLELHVGLLG